MTGAVANLSLVEGVLFYYPTKAGNYTKPNTQTVIVDLAVDGDDSSVRDGPEADKDENIKPDMIDIYWQDRLVPETKLTMLPFMPECKTPLQCEKNLVPVDWRDRLHGFLFFGWDFRHISNNKLKFQVDPNMNEWLNDKNRFRDEVLSEPKQISNVFLRLVLVARFSVCLHCDNFQRLQVAAVLP